MTATLCILPLPDSLLDQSQRERIAVTHAFVGFDAGDDR
jgi:hypothetical protein